MISLAKDNVTERLKALPDLQPPADAWQRVQARAKRDRRRIAWPVTAVATAAALGVIAFLVRPILQIDPTPVVQVAPVESRIVPGETAASAEDFDVRMLQRRSRQIEQMLQGMPVRAQIVRADTEGAIVELEDRIAAVDYELNMAALKRATEGVSPSGRVIRGGAERSRFDRVYEVQAVGAGAQRSRVLWQRRVELMDQLLQVRYVEAGAAPF